MSEWYAYIWLDVNQVPYYVGKGHGDRAFENHQRRNGCSVLRPADRSRILILSQPDEAKAFEMERRIIAFLGRDTLLNVKAGGRCSPVEHLTETRRKIGLANTRAARMRRRMRRSAEGRKYAMRRWGHNVRMEF